MAQVNGTTDSNFELELGKLHTMLSNHLYTSQERVRAGREISVVRERLEKREYSRCSYVTNKLNIPERMEDFFSEIIFYAGVGRTWEKIFSALNIARVGTALDLCPGLGPKVEIGLMYAGFEGQITVVDKDAKALRRLQEFLSIFNPPFQIKPRESDLFSVRGKYNLVVGNHILDDLILNEACSRFSISLSDVYESEPLLRETWTRAISERTSIESAMLPRIADFLTRVCGADGRVVISQYPSYVERMLELKDMTAWMRRSLRKLRAALIKRGFVDESEPVRRALKGRRHAFAHDEVIIMRAKSESSSAKFLIGR